MNNNASIDSKPVQVEPMPEMRKVTARAAITAAPTPPASAQDDAKVYHFEQRNRFGPWIEVETPTERSVEFVQRADAPAAGDARLLARALDLLERNKPFYGQIGSRDVDVGASLKNWEEITTEMRSAIAASQQQEG